MIREVGEGAFNDNTSLNKSQDMSMSQYPLSKSLTPTRSSFIISKKKHSFLAGTVNILKKKVSIISGHSRADNNLERKMSSISDISKGQ